MNLKNLMPDYYKDVYEMEKIIEVEQNLLDEAGSLVQQVRRNQYIATADETTIRAWEKILDLSSSPDEPLKLRRNRVLSKTSVRTPFTNRYLKDLLLSFDENMIVDFDQNDYELNIIAHLEVVGLVDEFDRVLSYIMPANIAVDSKNEIHCHAKGEAYTTGGMVYASIYELSDQYDIDFNIKGNYELGSIQSITNMFELDDSYYEGIDLEGTYSIGNALTETIKIELDESYFVNFDVDGESEAGVNVGNVQVITVKG